MRRMLTTTIMAMLLVVGVTTPAWAQAPDPAMIEQMVREELDKIPDTVVEMDGLAKITYKAIPTDPAEIVKNNPQLAQRVPPGFNIDAMAKQYGPMIQEYLNKYLADIATFEALEDLKYRSKTIPKGKYTMGLEFSNADIVGAVIYGEGLKKPVAIRFKTKSTPMPEKELSLEMEENEKETKKGTPSFDIVAKFAKSTGKSAYPLKKD